MRYRNIVPFLLNKNYGESKLIRSDETGISQILEKTNIISHHMISKKNPLKRKSYSYKMLYIDIDLDMHLECV